MKINRVVQAIAFTFASAALGNLTFANVPCSGAGFTPLRPVDVDYIQHAPSGVWNLDSVSYHYVMGNLGTLAVDTNNANNRSVWVKGKNFGQSLTCFAYFTRTSDGLTWSGSATTTANGAFVIAPTATIPAGNQGQELAVQLQCGLPPTPSGGSAAVVFSAS